MKKILKNKKILIGIIMVTFVIIIAIISIFYTPNDPYLVNLSVKFSNPNQKFLLGTDNIFSIFIFQYLSNFNSNKFNYWNYKYIFWWNI